MGPPTPKLAAAGPPGRAHPIKNKKIFQSGVVGADQLSENICYLSNFPLWLTPVSWTDEIVNLD